eukprot:1194640-Prymnesium_polylepis.1
MRHTWIQWASARSYELSRGLERARKSGRVHASRGEGAVYLRFASQSYLQCACARALIRQLDDTALPRVERKLPVRWQKQLDRGSPNASRPVDRDVHHHRYTERLDVDDGARQPGLGPLDHKRLLCAHIGERLRMQPTLADADHE